MKKYLVGGAVRDKLLGLEPKEKDWVVGNSSAEELVSLGYKQVGKHFPVFLHPNTFEEHALARVEKKINKGHQGFEFNTGKSITLEEDLLRRDLTINAIAEDENNKLIDPYNGVKDIENRKLRHVSDAFSEDPLRVFRVARFYASLSDYNFTIHDSTYTEMKSIVDSGEIESLSKERLWEEFSKAFSTKEPWKFFEALINSGAAKKYFPEVIDNAILKKKIIYFNKQNISKDIFLSLIGFSVDFLELFGFPKKIIGLYFIFNEFGVKFLSLDLKKELVLNFLNELDAFRRPDRLYNLLIQINCFLDFHGKDEHSKINIFDSILKQIESKISYGDLTNLNVDQIKHSVENTNLNIINKILSKNT